MQYLNKYQFTDLEVNKQYRNALSNKIGINNLPKINFIGFNIKVESYEHKFMQCNLHIVVNNTDIVRTFWTGMFAGDSTYFYDVTNENIEKCLTEQLCVIFGIYTYPKIQFSNHKLSYHPEKVYDYYKDQISLCAEEIVNKYNKFLELEYLV